MSDLQYSFNNNDNLRFQILNDLQYADNYYECLIDIFNLIDIKSPLRNRVLNENLRDRYLHSQHKLFAMTKVSKLISSKLTRNVRIAEQGLIQIIDGKDERVLDYVDLLSIIEASSELPSHTYRLAFIEKKHQIKWVYCRDFVDARKIRDYCIVLAAKNALQYNISGMLQLLGKIHKNQAISGFLQKISKTSAQIEFQKKFMNNSIEIMSFKINSNDSYVSNPFESQGIQEISNQITQNYLEQIFQEVLKNIEEINDDSISQESSSLNSYQSEFLQITQEEIPQTVWLNYADYFKK